MMKFELNNSFVELLKCVNYEQLTNHATGFHEIKLNLLPFNVPFPNN